MESTQSVNHAIQMGYTVKYYAVPVLLGVKGVKANHFRRKSITYLRRT